MIIKTISDIIQSAFNMGLETVELSTGWYIIQYIACLQLIKGTSVVISINKLVMIINVYDTLAKGCQHYLQEFKEYSYKISQHWKKTFSILPNTSTSSCIFKPLKYLIKFLTPPPSPTNHSTTQKNITT